jgi:hypothetical protein
MKEGVRRADAMALEAHLLDHLVVLVERPAAEDHLEGCE